MNSKEYYEVFNQISCNKINRQSIEVIDRTSEFFTMKLFEIFEVTETGSFWLIETTKVSYDPNKDFDYEISSLTIHSSQAFAVEFAANKIARNALKEVELKEAS